MGDLWRTVLWSAIHGISDQNYDQSFAFCRLWLGIGQTYSQNPPGQLFDAIYYNRATSPMDPASSKLIHPTAHLVLRFVNDAESDPILAPSNPGLQNRLCAMILREFFENNLRVVTDTGGRLGELAADQLPADANYIAHWANLGYVEEAAIHDHILQSLISHPILHDHQADALIILFKLAGATFAEYADPSVVNRCFELLKDHYPPGSVKSRLVQVCVFDTMRGSYRDNTHFQEVVKLRERDWEGLHPPPVFTTERLKPTDANQKDSAATPIVTPPGLPNEKLEPQIPRPAPLESVATPEIDTVTASPNTQSSSISIKILSDFTIVDVSDVDLTVITPHETFYLEDGNVEVLCENTLFRVHTSILSFHSPALHRVFAQTNLATTESPNGCPRILTSDMATDFGMLLKTIYLPGFVAPLTSHEILPLTVRLSIGPPRGTKHQTSLLFRPSSESRQSTSYPLSDISYSKPYVMGTRRLLRRSFPPNRLERPSSADQLPTRTRSSAYLSSKGSRPHYRRHTTWRRGEAQHQ